METETVLFEGNFAVLTFYDGWGSDTTWMIGIGDLLILNLATRKKFWMTRSVIENQIKTKVTDVDDDGNPYDLDDFLENQSSIREMTIGTHEIEVKYQIEYQTHDHGQLTLGSLKSHKWNNHFTLLEL